MNESRNPYAPPTADVADIPGASPDLGAATFIQNGQRVPIGNGVRWMTHAFRLFFQAPWKWIGVLILVGALSFIAGLIPFVNLVLTIFWPVVGGGVIYAIHQQRTTGSFEFGSIFSGFGPRFGQLALVGLVLLLSFPLMIITFVIMLGGDIAMMLATGGSEPLDPLVIESLGLKMLLAFLVYMLLAIPLIAATYLAPALIMLHECKAGAAMKMSFIGLIKNILPGLVFGIVMFLVFVASAIPLGLGLLITLPVAMIATYTMYRDIFVDEEQ